VTEFELIETWYLTRQILANSFVTISTTVFAYVIVSHFVGKALNSGVAVMLTTIYSLFLFGPVGDRLFDLSRRWRVAVEYVERFPEGVVINGVPPTITIYIFGMAPILLAWALSIYYFHFVIRRRAPNSDGDT